MVKMNELALPIAVYSQQYYEIVLENQICLKYGIKQIKIINCVIKKYTESISNFLTQQQFPQFPATKLNLCYTKNIICFMIIILHKDNI